MVQSYLVDHPAALYTTSVRSSVSMYGLMAGSLLASLILVSSVAASLTDVSKTNYKPTVNSEARNVQAFWFDISCSGDQHELLAISLIAVSIRCNLCHTIDTNDSTRRISMLKVRFPLVYLFHHFALFPSKKFPLLNVLKIIR